MRHHLGKRASSTFAMLSDEAILLFSCRIKISVLIVGTAWVPSTKSSTVIAQNTREMHGGQSSQIEWRKYWLGKAAPCKEGKSAIRPIYIS